MITDVEAEMLRRYQLREERVKEEYNAIFHPSIKQREISAEEERAAMHRLIATPAEEAKTRKLIMYSGEKEAPYDNLKQCAEQTGMDYQKIKGCLSWQKGIFYKAWKSEVRFKFVYE